MILRIRSVKSDMSN